MSTELQGDEPDHIYYPNVDAELLASLDDEARARVITGMRAPTPTAAPFASRLQPGTVAFWAKQDRKLRKLLKLPEGGPQWWQHHRERAYQRWAKQDIKIGKRRPWRWRKKRPRFPHLKNNYTCPRCSGSNYFERPEGSSHCFDCNYPVPIQGRPI